jgi:hypothetical protein
MLKNFREFLAASPVSKYSFFCGFIFEMFERAMINTSVSTDLITTVAGEGIYVAWAIIC